MEYASRAVGNAGLTTGIIGTALGAVNLRITQKQKKKQRKLLTKFESRLIIVNIL